MPVCHVNRKGPEPTNPINFFVNGKPYTVSGEYDLTTNLNDFLREGAGLRGTKVMCREGGCGCCAVTVTVPDPISGQDNSFSINSCLCPLYTVDGWQITTVEGIGSSKKGFHPIQDRVASFNGSQCGYCTPGMVMNMYGLVHQKTKLSQQDVEDQFDGNICRCTGYRPILDAMKSFASDATGPGSKCLDIEDLNKGLCPRTGRQCKGSGSGQGLSVCTGGRTWHRPESLHALAKIMQDNKAKSLRLMFGNTASGVFKNEGPFDVYVDLHSVKELSEVKHVKKVKCCITHKEKDDGFQIGANVTLTRLMNLLEENKTKKGYEYFPAIVNHIKKIGNVLMRNAASWAGNVMMKNSYPEFPSDVFTVLEAAGAQIQVFDSAKGNTTSFPLLSLATELKMKGKVITSLILHTHDPKFKLRSFKIMPRSQNAHAHVNAGFGMTVDPTKFQVLGKPSLVFGGINKNTIHAVKTENFLTGKCLCDGVVLKTCLETLKSELVPDAHPAHATPQYRRSLAINLLYKYILEICGAKQPLRATGSQQIARPLSSGKRAFPDKKSEWPLKQAMPKLAAPFQASGEAEYVNDIPSSAHELCGAFVITSKGPAKIGKIDASQALAMSGVVDFITADHIPKGGANNSLPSLAMFPLPEEPLFCKGDVLYAGQAVGLILAESQTLAEEAAEKVQITYTNEQTPILTLEDAIKKESFWANPFHEHSVGDPEGAMKKAAKKLSGQCSLGSATHFFMENNVTLCVPTEDRLDVYSSTQGVEFTQAVVSIVTGKPMNYINVTVPRVGGGFGGKCFGSLSTSAAAALAAFIHNRPVKVNVGLSTCMKMLGKRLGVLVKYDVGFDEKGQIQVISLDVYGDGGNSFTGVLPLHEMYSHLDQGYHVPNWRIKMIGCKTHKAPNLIMRGPGPFPGGFVIENIMEHVSKHLQRNPLDVKELNLYAEGQTDMVGHKLDYCTMKRIWKELRTSAEVDKRQNEINSFNKTNQWKKRAITMTPVKYGFDYSMSSYTADVAIYARDGTITVSTGGVEMGQGLNTKLIQAVAMALGIPVTMVKVRPSNSHIGANSFITGGSVASELAVASALQCCETLKERLAPIKAKNPDYDWPTLVKTCDIAGIELTAKFKSFPAKLDKPGQFRYFTYCAGVTEVELDVLTGENQIRRLDILFDCGESLNPTIDIGQIEGAYVMGMGSLLLEDIVYDPKTGAVLNDGTWEYKPPTTKDIPVDIRIQLLPDAPNPHGIRGSKASGEPPIVIASGALFALKQAMEAASLELTGNKDFQKTVAPLTVERLMLGCGVDVSRLVL